MKFARVKNTVWTLAIALALWQGVTFAAQIFLKPQAAPRETLCEHLYSQLTSREAGNSANYLNADFSVVTNFWLRDVINITGNCDGKLQSADGSVSIYASAVTPIAPHFCIGAAHAGGLQVSNAFWTLPDGTFYTNGGAVNTNVVGYAGTALQEFVVTNTDIAITLTAKTNAFFLKYLPDISAKVPYCRNHNVAANPAPVFVRFHLTPNIGWPHTTWISCGDGAGNFGGNVTMWGTPKFGDYASNGDSGIGGDSGGAAFAIINNEAAIIGCMSSAGYHPAIWQHADEINARMAAMCVANGLPIEQLTPCDLSQFPDL